MIKSLQSLRGVCALLIVAHHFGFTSAVVESFGDFAVALFMMLSGFVLAIAYRGRVTAGTDIPAGRFMFKRLARIVPLYLLGQLAMMAIMQFNIAPSKAIADLLMVQSWIPSADYYFSANSPSWFVSDLILCYVLFIPVLTFVYRRPRVANPAGVILLAVYFAVTFCVPQPLVHPIVYIFPPMQFPAFLAGIFLSRLYKENTRNVAPLTADIVIPAVTILIVAQMFAARFIPDRLSLASYWWPASAMAILFLARFDNVACRASKILRSFPLVTLGNVSYALYILHLPLLRIWRIGWKHIGITLPEAVDFVTFCMVAIAVATVVHRFFEKPVTKKLDQL